MAMRTPMEGELFDFARRVGIHPAELMMLPREMVEDAMRHYRRGGLNDHELRDYLLRRIERVKQENMMQFGNSHPMTATELQERIKEMGATFNIPTTHAQQYQKQIEEAMLKMQEAAKVAELTPVQKVVEKQTTERGPIKISYTNDIEHDACVVTLRLPYNFVADSTMPKDQRDLFEMLMRSTKISDQLLGLEALVRYEEVRIQDAKVEKEKSNET